jgi:hypothetical protein
VNLSAAVLLLQLAAAPADLGTVRVALEAADTAAAVAQLQEMAMRPVLSADGLAAVFLIDWIARGRFAEAARAVWREAIAHHRSWWVNAKRGALMPPVIEERRGDLLQIAAATRGDRPKTLEGLSSALSRDWRDVLTSMAGAYEADDSLLAGGAAFVSSLAVGIPADAHGTYIARLKVTDTATGATSTAQRAFFIRG